MTVASLQRLRVGVRAALGLALAVSLVANVLHASDNPISQAISAWPPLALMLTVELISRVPAKSRALSVARMAATIVIAGIAAWVSYWHMSAVAMTYGETGHGAQYLWPLTVDGLAVVASICLVEIGGRLAAMAKDDSVATPPAAGAKALAEPTVATNDAATPDGHDEWPDPWSYSTPLQTGGNVATTTAVDPDVEVATWLDSSNGRRELAVAKTTVATAARRSVAKSYDEAKVLEAIRRGLGQITGDMAKAEADAIKRQVDAATVEATGLSLRQARRLRGQVTGEPVSGPPSDSE